MKVCLAFIAMELVLTLNASAQISSAPGNHQTKESTPIQQPALRPAPGNAAGPDQAPSQPGSVNAQQAPVPSIFYTGQIDGFIGSWYGNGSCSPVDGCSPEKALAAIAEMKKAHPGSVLVGMGDNFGLDAMAAQYDPTAISKKRINPDLSASTIRFVESPGDSGAYDAVSPGIEDFSFGAEFLYGADTVSKVPLIADNLTVGNQPPPACSTLPSPSPSLPLLPNQISASLSGSGSGGGGKSGGGKGGSGAGAASGGASGGGAPSGGSSGAGGGSGCSSGGAGAAGTPSGGDQKTVKGHAPPTLVWPTADNIYPWTTAFAFTPDPSLTTTPDSSPAKPQPSLAKPSGPPQITVRICTVDIQKQTGYPDGCSDSNGSPSPDGGSYSDDKPSLDWAKNAYGDAPSGTVRFVLGKSDIPIQDDGTIKSPAAPSSNVPQAPGKAAVSKLFLCVWAGLNIPSTTPPATPCTQLNVHVSFFDHAWRTPKNSQGPLTYVVFGALASDTLNGLAAVNQQWLPLKDPAIYPQISVADAGSAVSQAIAAYNIINPDKNAFGIVLAQMSPGEAKMLADYLGARSPKGASSFIRVIISAADSTESSPRSTVTVDDPDPYARNTTRFIPVYTPDPIFREHDCLSAVGDCIAELQTSPDSANHEYVFTNMPAQAVIASRRDPDLQSRASSASINAAQPQTGWGDPFCEPSDHSWVCNTLHEMQRAVDADIAVLEQKNFDYARVGGMRPDSSLSQGQSLKILWNAGNLTRVSLSGSTIRSILTAIQKTQGQNFEVSSDARKLQQLKILGIYQDGPTYYINGIPLNSAEIYSVATTDNLANSTSDYPQFASVDLIPPATFWKNNQTYPIAGMGEEALGNNTISSFAQNQVEAQLESGLSHLLSPKKASEVPASAAFTYSSRTMQEKDELKNSIVNDVETRPLWSATLQQGALSFSESKPSQQDQYIGDNLGGVTNPNVVSPYSNSISLNGNAREEAYASRKFCLIFPRCDTGFDEQINFQRSRQGSTTTQTASVTTTGSAVPTESLSYSGNSYIVSPFIEFQLSRFPDWKPFVARPPLFTSNIVALPEYLASMTKGVDFFFSQRKTYSVGFDFGTRYERNDFNYLEIGYTHQHSWDVLSALNQNVTGSTPCVLTGQSTLKSCASGYPGTTGSLLIATYNQYSQLGGYWLGIFTHPLAPNVLYQGTTFGNIFAFGPHSQSTVLTHYAVEETNSIQFAIPKINMTIGPTYNVFFFEANQRHTIGATLTRQDIGAQANYMFNWHSGLPLQSLWQGKSQ